MTGTPSQRSPARRRARRGGGQPGGRHSDGWSGRVHAGWSDSWL